MNDDPPYEIDIINRSAQDDIDSSILRQSVSAALRQFSTPRATISVAIVSDQEMARLHEKYRQTPGPTDVLAFDLADSESGDSMVDGEIIMSAETAARSAKDKGHSTEAELALYAVHGTLHLLGMDDSSPRQAGDMHKMEDEILITVGIGPVFGGQHS